MLGKLEAFKGRKYAKRVGRGDGSGLGHTAGKGHKGQKSRSGCKISPQFEGGQMPISRRFPKRGFTNIFKTSYQVVNVDDLNKRFEAGAEVDYEKLYELRLIRKGNTPVKILGTGTIDKSLTVKANAFTKSAVEKIEKAGGKAEVV